MLFKSCEIGQKVVDWDYKGTCLAITFCYGKHRGLHYDYCQEQRNFFLGKGQGSL